MHTTAAPPDRVEPSPPDDVGTAPPGRPTAVERDVTVGGRRLRLRQVGDPAAPPVLFLHGIMGHRRDWDVLIDALGVSRHVLALDQRGHGESDHAPSYRVDELADDAIELVDTLEVGPVALIGHSMGAMAAVVAAARRPDLVRTLVLVDMVPEIVRSDFASQMPAMFDALADARYDTVDAAVDEWQATNPLADRALLRNYVDHALRHDGTALRWGFDARGLRDFSQQTEPADLWAAIDAVSCPTLVVRGEHSPLTTRAGVAELARRVGDGTVVEIPGGGHDLGVEQPWPVAVAAATFLDRSVP